MRQKEWNELLEMKGLGDVEGDAEIESSSEMRPLLGATDRDTAPGSSGESDEWVESTAGESWASSSQSCAISEGLERDERSESGSVGSQGEEGEGEHADLEPVVSLRGGDRSKWMGRQRSPVSLIPSLFARHSLEEYSLPLTTLSLSPSPSQEDLPTPLLCPPRADQLVEFPISPPPRECLPPSAITSSHQESHPTLMSSHCQEPTIQQLVALFPPDREDETQEFRTFPFITLIWEWLCSLENRELMTKSLKRIFEKKFVGQWGEEGPHVLWPFPGGERVGLMKILLLSMEMFWPWEITLKKKITIISSCFILVGFGQILGLEEELFFDLIVPL
jgi:hypothetical protein